MKSDLDIVSVDKKLMSVSQYLHTLATKQGMADVALMDHDMSAKVHAAVICLGITVAVLQFTHYL